MIISRRGLLGIGAAFLAAPAIVRVSSLMPVSTRIPGYRPVRWIPYEKAVTDGVQWMDFVWDEVPPWNFVGVRGNCILVPDA